MSQQSIPIGGFVEAILELQTFPSGFSKRTLVINDGDAKYPQTIPVEFVKDKTALLDGLVVGQEVTAHVNLRGNEHNGKYYASIQGWKLEKGEAPAGSRQSGQEPRNMSVPSNRNQQQQDDYEEDGDIPF